MKRQAEKADIVKRKVFHEHIILLTEGRFLMLAVLAVMVWLPYLFVRDRMAGMTPAWWEIPFLLLVEVSHCFVSSGTDALGALWSRRTRSFGSVPLCGQCG